MRNRTFLRGVAWILSAIIVFAGVFCAAAEKTGKSAGPKQLRVKGNQVVQADSPGKVVRLTGMNIPSLEWCSGGEHVMESLVEAKKNWNSNVIRVPLSVARWYGCEQWQSSPDDYRKIVDDMIQAAAARNMYVILDCHWSNGGQGEIVRREGVKNTDKVGRFNGQKCMPDEEVKAFWLEIAALYGNHPAVLFNLYNEPHGVSWEMWRNGGTKTEHLFDLKSGEHKEKEYMTVGHQQLVEAIRDAGAKNVIVAGGLDWGYDLRGISGEAGDEKVYALVDQSTHKDPKKRGFGIIYDTHIYPWKGNTQAWENCIGGTRKQHPVIAGECGWDWETIKVIRSHTDLEKEPQLNHPVWVPELLDWFDAKTSSLGTEFGNQMHWTGWCFHPAASPRILKDWDYTPTEFWGKYVKERLNSY